MPGAHPAPRDSRNEQEGSKTYPLEVLIGLQNMLQEGIPERFVTEPAEVDSRVCAPSQPQAVALPPPAPGPNWLTLMVLRLLAMIRLITNDTHLKARTKSQSLSSD